MWVLPGPGGEGWGRGPEGQPPARSTAGPGAGSLASWEGGGARLRATWTGPGKWTLNGELKGGRKESGFCLSEGRAGARARGPETREAAAAVAERARARRACERRRERRPRLGGLGALSREQRKEQLWLTLERIAHLAGWRLDDGRAGTARRPSLGGHSCS